MRIVYLLVALLGASCASMRPTATPSPAPDPPETMPLATPPKRVETPPEVCEFLVSAINRGDWEALKPWTKPGTSSNATVQVWQDAAKAGNPVIVGRFLNGQTVGGASKKPYKLYSYSLQNKDGTVNPHWLQIKVRESDGQAEIEDFWNFGW